MTVFIVFMLTVLLGAMLYVASLGLRSSPAPTEKWEWELCARCRDEVPAWNIQEVLRYRNEDRRDLMGFSEAPGPLDEFVGQRLCDWCRRESPIRWGQGETRKAFRQREIAIQERWRKENEKILATSYEKLIHRDNERLRQ